MRTYGLLMDWISSPYHQSVWLGVQQVCREQGVNLLTLVAGSAAQAPRWDQVRGQLTEFVDGQAFDGFLFLTASLVHALKTDDLAHLVSRVSPTPVVSLGGEVPGASPVLIDTREGFRRLLGHLYDVHGYRKFAFAGGPSSVPDAALRKEQFLGFAADRGLEIPEDRILEGPFSGAWGAEAVDLLVPGDRPGFEVLVCADDEIARGALERLSKKNLLVPGDLAVTGFDDSASAALAALTTASQPLVSLGRTGANLLGDLIDGRTGPGPRFLEAEPVVRQSCGCLSLAALASQVAPVAETDRTFAQEIRLYRKQLLDDLTLEGLPEAHAQGLFEAFAAGWERQDTKTFLQGLQRVLAAMEQERLPPGRLHYPLSVFRRWVLRSTEPAVRRAFAEATIHQARIVLTEALDRQAVRTETHRILLGELLSALNERLVFSRTFSDQARVLTEFFPRLGIRRFRFTAYGDPAQPMQTARLVATEAGELPDGGLPYDPRRLFAEGEAPLEEPWSFVAEGLFERNAPLGFFFLEAREDPGLLSVFDQLGERISRGIETVRRIQSLEDQVAQRTAELRDALGHLEAHNLKLKELALRDELTGLYNRRGFLTLAEHQLKAHSRKGHDMTLFFGDLDGLKKINDTFGHDAGDEAIRTAARLLVGTFRIEDVVARLGGDEFVVLAPGCGGTDAAGLADRLARAFAGTASGRYGISLGWIVIPPRTNRPLADWMRDADEALYREKQAKRARRADQPK